MIARFMSFYKSGVIVIISINADPTVLVYVLLVLLYYVKYVSIDIIGLICHHSEYGACS